MYSSSSRYSKRALCIIHSTNNVTSPTPRPRCSGAVGTYVITWYRVCNIKENAWQRKSNISNYKKEVKKYGAAVRYLCGTYVVHKKCKVRAKCVKCKVQQAARSTLLLYPYTVLYTVLYSLSLSTKIKSLPGSATVTLT